jgi:hypothetical protein
MSTKVWILFCSIIILSAFACGRFEEKKSNNKPVAPIEIDLRFANTSQDNKETGIIFSASPSINVEELELEVKLPQGISHSAGDCKWKGRLEKGKTKELKFSCIISDKNPKEIFAIASIRIDKDTRLSKVTSLLIGNPPAKLHKPIIQKNHRGENIVEFQGRLRR